MAAKKPAKATKAKKTIAKKADSAKKAAPAKKPSVVAKAKPAPAPRAVATKPAAKPAAPSGEDKYVGYYYPKPNSTETYESAMQTIAGVDRPQRVQFVTVVSQGTIQSSYRVPYAVFVKGEKADKLIVVGLAPNEFGTIYRMRALLANMTTMSRMSPFFQAPIQLVIDTEFDKVGK